MNRIPHVVALDFSRVHPAGSPEYWELRFSCCDGSPAVTQIIGSGGTKTRSQLAPSVVAALDAARASTGFSAGCLPGHCFKYIASVNGGVTLHASRVALVNFLGEIDTDEEAVLLVDANSYSWGGSADTGMRVNNGGWEFVVLEMVKFCAPVQTDRVHLRVQRNGQLTVLGREVWQKDNHSCV